jgi:hypothetical protein
MSFPTHSRPRATEFATEDLYPALLAFLLAGYAIFSKAFAYLGLGPFYIGDIVFALGAVAFLRLGCVFASLATLPSVLLALLFGWAVIRTLPYLGQYGLDAPRDSVIVVYGGFAFIVTAVLLEKPERLPLVIKFLRALGSIIIVVGPLLLLTQVTWSGAEAAQRFAKAGTLAVHLTGAALMMLLGFRRTRIVWLVFLIVGMALASMMNRSAMLIISIPLAVAVISSGKWRELFFAFSVAAGLVGGAYALGATIPTTSSRDISAEQLVDNFISIFGESQASDSSELEGTKNWRLAWWHTILNYTLDGPYFWTGKGFGINLASSDGFVVGDRNGIPLLRNPHNGHLTILARAGVPGLALWLLTLASWSAMLLTNMVRARISGDNAWADFFLLIFCYALGFIVEGTFDVALEGPMSGIWFWCLFGVGIGATMIYRAGSAPVRVATQPDNREMRLA